ncbi:head vertex assembly chaperone [Pectobacterium phage POP12]|nr:head vertex assembly chaperone [Pectobacterium phage POP12]
MGIEQKARNMINDAFSDVIQELVIIDKNGKTQLVFIHSVKDTDKGLQIEFSTPNEDKESLFPLVQEAIQAQIDSTVVEPKIQQEVKRCPPRRKKKKSLWQKILDFVGGIHF